MESLRGRTAKSLKWNMIDRLSTQVLYAVVGVVLANILSKEDFGLVGALLIFQAFGTLFVDGGFGAALLRKKYASLRDWSTVFWFNLSVSLTIYLILFFAAPLIARIFQNDTRLIALSRVMFLSFVLNGLGFVQTNRLTKQLDVKRVAMANVTALTLSGIVGVVLALRGAGAWALVWQTVSLAAVKSGVLWLITGWRPAMCFSRKSMRSIWRVGMSVFASSSLNTFFLYIYNFVIGAFYSLVDLGVYTQADKWSKMGSASISQVLTSSFVPVLAGVQNDGDNFRRYVGRINRFTGFVLFPVMAGIAVMGPSIFHLLFGSKWDAAIPLFQILTIRGIFVVLISLYTNYLLALGYARRLFYMELVKDGMIFMAILATVWEGSMALLVWGQMVASVATWVVTLVTVSHAMGMRIGKMLGDLAPFAAITMIAVSAAVVTINILPAIGGDGRMMEMINALVGLCVIALVGGAVYLGVAQILRLPEMQELRSKLSSR